MKGLEQIKADNRPKKKPKAKAKPKKKPRRGMTVVIDASLHNDLVLSLDNDWRVLAADAIRSFREIAVLTDDDVRRMALGRVAQLERRMAVLAGQLEMFS